MKNTRRSKRTGQNFLINNHIASLEAEHASEKNVLEMGPGRGMLTRELCKKAKRVIAVEKDSFLYNYLKETTSFENLKLINADFFDLDDKELDAYNIDIMISNVPYYLSSKIITWLHDKKLHAVLCLQKEFVEHMTAKEDTGNYSRLSVICSLSFTITEIMSVSRKNFDPKPKVDSKIIYIRPKRSGMTDEEFGIIGALMQHKKKTVKNAIIDSHSYFKKEKKELSDIAENIKEKEERLFKLKPEQILGIAGRIARSVLQKE